MTAPELDIRVPLATLAKFSADGHVYRAYAHAIVALTNLVVMVPIALIDGDLTVVIDRCPIPWPEATAILDKDTALALMRGIVGRVEIIDCVREHTSPWKDKDQFGYVLRNAQPLPFTPWRGKLGFFEVPDEVVKR